MMISISTQRDTHTEILRLIQIYIYYNNAFVFKKKKKNNAFGIYFLFLKYIFFKVFIFKYEMKELVWLNLTI